MTRCPTVTTTAGSPVSIALNSLASSLRGPALTEACRIVKKPAPRNVRRR